MKIEFENEKGQIVKLEDKDRFTPRYDKIFETQGEYTNYLLGGDVVTKDGVTHNVRVRLTAAQKTMVEKNAPFIDKMFKAYDYNSKHRSNCVGLTPDVETKAEPVKPTVETQKLDADIEPLDPLKDPEYIKRVIKNLIKKGESKDVIIYTIITALKMTNEEAENAYLEAL